MSIVSLLLWQLGDKLSVLEQYRYTFHTLTMSIMSLLLWQLGDKLPVLEQYRSFISTP